VNFDDLLEECGMIRHNSQRFANLLVKQLLCSWLVADCSVPAGFQGRKLSSEWNSS